MINGWGMSEICSALAQPVGDLERIRAHPSAVGMPHLTVEMKLVDSEGREVGVGEPGEIWTRGSNVTPGYWRRPELNATAFQDGWFKTGDVAVQDADGFYSIVDRIKDMFISGGENVYPAEVEATIVELDAVGDVAVIGIPDQQWGEVGCAFVVVAPGKSLDVATLEAHCRKRLAKFKAAEALRDHSKPAAHAIRQGAEAPAAGLTAKQVTARSPRHRPHSCRGTRSTLRGALRALPLFRAPAPRSFRRHRQLRRALLLHRSSRR